MKKITLLLIVLIFKTLSSFSQFSFELSKGKEEEMRTDVHLKNIISDGKGNAYLLYYPGRGIDYYIGHFNDSLVIDKRESLSLWVNSKNQTIESFDFFHDSIYLFTSAMDTWLNKKHLFLRTFSPKTLKPNPPILIDESANILSFFPHYYVTFSENRDKMLVFCITETNKVEKTMRIKLTVFGKGLKKIMEDEKTFTGLNSAATLLQGEVDNQGNAFFLLQLYQESIFDVRAKFKNQMAVMSFYQGSKSYRIDRIDYPFKYVRDVEIVPDHQGNIHCVGLYSENFTNDYSKGTFFVTIDSLRGKIVNRISPYDYYFLQTLQTKKELKSGEELFNYHIHKTFIRPDKSVVMILEQRYSDYNGTNISSTNSQYYTHGFSSGIGNNQLMRYNNIIIFKLKSDGEIDWSRIIEKEQNRKEMINFCSLGVYTPQDTSEFYLFYNEDRRNPKRKPKPDAKPNTFQFTRKFYSSLKMVSVSNFGEMKNEKIIETDPKQCVPTPTFNYDGNNGEFIMIGQYYRRVNLLRLRQKK